MRKVFDTHDEAAARISTHFGPEIASELSPELSKVMYRLIIDAQLSAMERNLSNMAESIGIEPD